MIIHRILEARRKAREAKNLECRRSHIAYCIRNSDIKMEDLIPIPDDEYDRIVDALEEKVQKLKADEPEFTVSDNQMPDGTIIRGYTLRNIFAWREIVASMKSRVRDAYYIKNRPCGKCGEDNTVFFCFRSSDESWRELCGREGYMLICPDCLTIIGFVHYIMN
jgi:hypothetical protein